MTKFMNSETADMLNARKRIATANISIKIQEIAKQISNASPAEHAELRKQLYAYSETLEQMLSMPIHYGEIDGENTLFGEPYYSTYVNSWKYFDTLLEENRFDIVLKSLRKARIAVKRDIRTYQKQRRSLEIQIADMWNIRPDLNTLSNDDTIKFFRCSIKRDKLEIKRAKLQLTVNRLSIQEYILRTAIDELQRDMKVHLKLNATSDTAKQEAIA